MDRTTLGTTDLTCQCAQFITSLYPLEAFCSANTSFAVSLWMFKQLVHGGIQTN